MNRLKRIFLWSQIFSIIALLALFTFAITIYPEPKPYPNHIHSTLYLDRNFDDFEQEAITKAALEWTSTTNHIVEFDIVQLPAHEKIDIAYAVIITKVSPDYPNVIILDAENGDNTLGYYDRNSVIPHIALVTDRLKDDKYSSVVLHELGHSLGLEHLEGSENLDTLMYPYVNIIVNGISLPAGSDHITLKDGQKFCKLYHCDPMKLKYQEEPFHF